MTLKNFYLNPLIAMSVLAVLFFLILVVILAIWCKKRRQTEVKTVVIQPKKRPVSTKPVKQVNGGNGQRNGDIDVEAGAVTSDEVELTDGPQQETGEQPSHPVDEQKLSDHTEDSNAQIQQGEINPSFEHDTEQAKDKTADDDAPES